MRAFDEQNRTGEIYRFISLVFPVNLAATAVAIAFDASGRGLGRAFSLENIVSSFTYSNCIGTLICIVLIYFSPRWSKNSLFVRLLKVTITIFAGTFLGVISARFIVSLIFPHLADQGLIPGWRSFVFSSGIAFTFGFAVYFYEISQNQLAQTKERLREKEFAAEKAKTLIVEAQLASLESRIHPHFLFNTLNSIAALIRDEPEKAEKIVEKLSALLRYSLDEHAKGVASLSDELEITQKYLEIENVRFGDRLEYKFETDGNLEKIKIPSLALQTLVENSIKHVASRRSEKTEIFVSAVQNGNYFILEVSDNGDGFAEKEIKEGHGLDNLKKRLNSIFQDKAHLEIMNNGAGKVRLKIPLAADGSNIFAND